MVMLRMTLCRLSVWRNEEGGSKDNSSALGDNHDDDAIETVVLRNCQSD